MGGLGPRRSRFAAWTRDSGSGIRDPGFGIRGPGFGLARLRSRAISASYGEVRRSRFAAEAEELEIRDRPPPLAV
jgi:hypothetical protein